MAWGVSCESRSPPTLSNEQKLWYYRRRMTTHLSVFPRTPGERSPEAVPGNVYGTTYPATSLSIDRRRLADVLKDTSESTIIVLDGLSEPVEVLVREVTFHPLRGEVTHVDFYAFERGREMTTSVPLEFSGEAPAVKQGAVVTKVRHDLTVTCRPSDLPGHLAVDLGVLTEPEARITAGDVALPTGVALAEAPDEVVAIANLAEEEAETVAAPDMEAIAVEEKGKGSPEA